MELLVRIVNGKKSYKIYRDLNAPQIAVKVKNHSQSLIHIIEI